MSLHGVGYCAIDCAIVLLFPSIQGITIGGR